MPHQSIWGRGRYFGWLPASSDHGLAHWNVHGSRGQVVGKGLGTWELPLSRWKMLGQNSGEHIFFGVNMWGKSGREQLVGFFSFLICNLEVWFPCCWTHQWRGLESRSDGGWVSRVVRHLRPNKSWLETMYSSPFGMMIMIMMMIVECLWGPMFKLAGVDFLFFP